MPPPRVGEDSVYILREAGFNEVWNTVLVDAGVTLSGEPFVHANYAAYR